MPTTLQELGLEAGVTALADQMPMPVRVRVAEPLGRMDAEVESTGYFVIAEALTNAVKHAAAQQITIDLAAKDGRLEIIVTDDGKGLADSTAGVRSAQPAGPGRGVGRDHHAPAGPQPRSDVAGGVRMRLIIAEDDVLLREGIARILGDEGYEIVAQAGDRDDLLEKVRTHHPDVVVTDIRMPPTFTRDGIAAALQIRRELPDIAIIVLSQHIDTPGALELLTLGADRIGYLLKSRVMDLDEFLDSVHRVVAGGSSIDPEVISSLVRRGVRDHQDHGVGLLTPRRLEVLQLMAQGFSNARIARELDVTEKAVDRSIGLIFQTLELPPSADEHRRVLAVMRYLNG